MDAVPKVEAQEEFADWKVEPRPLDKKPMEDYLVQKWTKNIKLRRPALQWRTQLTLMIIHE